jgi:UDP-2,3-diacylglucosamine hydrolase
VANLFISDLHLDESRPAITHALLDFLHNHAGKCESLYILGDLFEAWIGDDDDAPLATHIARALRAFQATGSRVFLMHGNRDFLLGAQFCAQADATLLSDPTVIRLEGRQCALMHGDSLCTDDQEYQSFRSMVREPAYQAELLSKPLQERRELAAQMRAMSSEATSNKAADIMDVNESAVAKAMETQKASLLIHGHTHRPARHVVALQDRVAERLVLGDWAKYGWYICAQDGSVDLIKFKIAH